MQKQQHQRRAYLMISPIWSSSSNWLCCCCFQLRTFVEERANRANMYTRNASTFCPCCSYYYFIVTTTLPLPFSSTLENWCENVQHNSACKLCDGNLHCAITLLSNVAFWYLVLSISSVKTVWRDYHACMLQASRFAPLPDFHRSSFVELFCFWTRHAHSRTRNKKVSRCSNCVPDNRY